ncbi:transporter [Stappia aggregata IAM 12614]|uniref:Transporter n=1 Tax=Roseibium aggregatum (strain ATCC 25650 / DSM 13394 / JCM 20685 / NBRC 16684 / NCIMB 2208 / IAM 12614 / B1) TaxID=384765 RepID=A0NY46_ROSAI|nr:TerC family protein [Roseibium aggregatum]EAV42390.1 transporter [Stappia aggregata IAM 12614] [Roseibium aggregatum IAM 12614]
MNLLLSEVMGEAVWMWGVFLALVLALLAFDLGVLHRRPHEIGIRESLLLSAFYISLGLLFSLWIWLMLGAREAAMYLTGFVVEKSLSLDNVFVIAVIFSFFAIPKQYQHRVLIYGILGVIVLRGLMIGAGTAIVSRFEWVLYLFAAFLVFTGVKMLFNCERECDVAANPVQRMLRKWLPLTASLHGDRFFVRSGSRFLATPLLLALVTVEFTDLIFAVDSIPAIFSITTDPYIVYTSNIFAILGLRALYFVLAVMMDRFTYLKYALSLVLVFIGSKIFVADLFDWEKFPPSLSLAITLLLICGGMLISLFVPRASTPQPTVIDLPPHPTTGISNCRTVPKVPRRS